MSLEDLEEAGALLPEEQWGEHSLETTASRPGMILTAVVSVAAGAGMYLGGGGALTWISGGVFIVDLMIFTWLSMRAVDAQSRRRSGKGAESSR